MSNIVSVFGHKNPDTDSVCASISYAYLKNKINNLDKLEYKPFILSDINSETKFVLKKFGLDKPDFLENVSAQVKDLNIKHTKTVNRNDSVNEVLHAIVNETGRSLPVVDDNGKMLGIISIFDIAPVYLGGFGRSLLKETKSPVKNLTELFDQCFVENRYEKDIIKGDIYTISEIDVEDKLKKDDILLSLCDGKYVKKSIESGSGIIIFCSYKGQSIKVPKSFDGIVIITEKTIFDVIKLVNSAVPVENFVKKDDIEYFMTYETIDDVKENMKTSKHTRFPVVDVDGNVMGTISRSNLFNINKKKVILVDHNEITQWIEGVDDSEIIQIIDHHRVANVQTSMPLFFRSEPVGSTCTIIAKMFRENQIEIPENLAGLMLSAILSDTLIFNSPTCTEEDKIIGKYLSEICNLDIESYGMEMIIEGSTYELDDFDDLITKDMKLFTFGKYKVSVSQVNAVNTQIFISRKDELKEKLRKFMDYQSLDLSLFMVTDIIAKGTQLFFVGHDKWIAQHAFDIDNDDTVFLPDVYSRKKQIIPKLMNIAML